ncbi:MAG: hypothetical protein D6695_09245 [Planctomycetota bacterium]|nr:MAG: hypothetical protein D6695_09245 [Planctomycetota bacterium]
MDSAPQTAEQWGPEAARLVVRQIDRWVRRMPQGTTITLLDTGIGSGEACMRLLRSARQRGRALRVVSIIDEHAGVEPYSSEQLEAFETVRMDPFAIVETFGAGSFDFVCSQLRVADLRDVPRLTWLRLLDRVAERGVVWVERFGAGGLDRHAMQELVDRVGMDYLRYRRPIGSVWQVMRGLKHRPGSA